MPTLSFFYGISIQMFWDDHPPPHFHVRYAGLRGRFSIEPLVVMTSNLPPAKERMVLQWAQLHIAELLENWERCQRQDILLPILGWL